MPYITADRRVALLSTDHDVPQSAGELNFLISKLLVYYLEEHGLSYATCNDVVGALDNAKSEFKRRVQDPYENVKIHDNGDIGYGQILEHHLNK